MTHIFDDTGKAHPVTVVRVEPNVVTQVKTAERDGYAAVQVGAGEQKATRLSKPERGHMEAASGGRENATYVKTLREFRIAPNETENWTVGSDVNVSAFEVGAQVEISASSKGKGFQGVVKRYGFSGGPRSHGQKHGERSVGSIGATEAARVFPGKRMPGRMGNTRVTVKNLTVMHVDTDRKELYIGGAIPGRPGTTVEVKGL